MLDAPALVEPRFLWVPDHAHTYGPDVADFAGSIGLELDAEQRMVLDGMYAVDKAGKHVCFEFCTICARQNLKTFIYEVAALADGFMFAEPLSIWTAHLFDTSQEAFRDMDALIAGTPFLATRVLRVSRANGDEGFELKNGARIKFKARSKSAGRGLTGDKVTLDEAFALSSKEMGALLPTVSARPNPQIRYGSSAGLEDSDILRGVRDRGRKGGDPSLGYIEWGSEEDSCADDKCGHELGHDGCALDDPENWRQANPAMGRRISETNIAAERRALATEPEEFARERLGWWSAAGAAVMPYPPKAWRDLTDTASHRDPDLTPVFCIDTNPVRTRTAIGAAGRREDGLTHLELVEYKPGTGWVVDRAKELTEKYGAEFVIFSDGAAASLIPALEDAGVTVVPYNTSEMTQACGALADAITDQTCRHIGQEELQDAVEMARKRERDGAWTLARKGGDIAPLVAVVGAHHRHITTDVDYDVLQSIY